MKKLVSLSLIASLALSVTLKIDNTKYQRTIPTTTTTITSFAPIVKKVIPSVVNISTTKVVKTIIPDIFKDPFFGQFFGHLPKKRVEKALGSGVIISKDGYIVTNNHVVSHAKEIVVFIKDKKYKAKLIGTDPKTDLAVIKISGVNLQPITFTDSANIQVGDMVLAIGNPFGLGETVTQGIISGINRDRVGINEYENFIQTDAAINPGNSGGALVDLKGRLVGINSAIISKSGGNNGIGFAIPSNMVRFVANSLIANGKVVRGYLGVEISDINKDNVALYGIDYGVLVNKVMPKSAASQAGLRAGDIIVAINGKKIKDAASLRNKIAFLGAGSKVTLKVYRNSRFISLTTTLKKLQTLKAKVDLLKGALLTQEGNKVIISQVLPKSPAYLIGLQKNDILVAVRTIKTKKWVKVHSISQLNDLLKGLTHSQALLQIQRNNEIVIVQI
ncbi:MAG: Do family serine endopeptidase [Epsilonproteobacteria bacterium]|nr:Do family serine endopeptidase [Campylobacterota bacterium]